MRVECRGLSPITGRLDDLSPVWVHRKSPNLGVSVWRQGVGALLLLEAGGLWVLMREKRLLSSRSEAKQRPARSVVGAKRRDVSQRLEETGRTDVGREREFQDGVSLGR